MSILDAFKELKRDNNNLQDLALLPQALIMQMAQRGEIQKELVPLIIGKKAEMIEATARNQALASSGQTPPTIMEQNMMQIAQAENPAPAPQEMAMPQQQMQQPMPQQQMPQEMAMPQPMPQGMPQLPEEVGIAQNPVPPMQMAGGGIIAFAPGGDVDDDDDTSYEEYLDELQRAKLESMIIRAYQDGSAGAGAGIAYAEPSKGEKGAKSKGKDEPDDLVKRLQAQIMAKESGGRRYDKEGNLLTSSKGAQGEMQVMPYTARDPGFGIRPARGNDPDDLRRVGNEYAAAMYNRYGDPKLAMIAYNMGPGATDKWLADGADPRKLPKETQGYIRGVSLAGGGEVKHFDIGGEIDTVGAELDALRSGTDSLYQELMRGGSRGGAKTPELQAAYENALTLRKQKEAEYQALMAKGGVDKPAFFPQSSLSTKRPEANPIVKREAAKMESPALTESDTDKMVGYRAQGKRSGATEENISKFLKDRTEGNTAPASMVKGPAPAVMSPEDKLFAQMQDAIAKREARLEAARKQDPYLAMVAAGLGMMGGTSPYALTNIGQGGAQGLSQYATTQKLRAAEEAGIGSLQNKMYSSSMTNALRRDLQAQTKARAGEDRELKRSTAKAEYIQKRLRNAPLTEQMLSNYRLKQVDGELTPKERRRLEHYEREVEKIELEAEKRFGSDSAGWSATAKG